MVRRNSEGRRKGWLQKWRKNTQSREKTEAQALTSMQYHWKKKRNKEEEEEEKEEEEKEAKGKKK